MQVLLVHPNAKLPSKRYGDAGFDIFMPEPRAIAPGPFQAGTGIAIALNENISMFVRPRSSVFMKGIHIHGTIDSSYRGEIMILGYNASREFFLFDAGERIAQLVPVMIPELHIEQINKNELQPTLRGINGFGSTGK